ncbi:Putative tetratricopeptide-like helical domain superfamily, nucleoside phosphorylase superfamily [Colletotrichum destructivum]|uniref:Tetratricopeptide-like helical domain superfamily, nucleoside phosphorylase superfamily n=1 Tax=Colletotrichum destructivum TaxID=34406 RepID=A0AAX4J370_9PEZI|nr:Putative tetratricopeptide-like helical domain superfamily, nucleoside phosphorylase superfamily [Colletotrichum destructivum]
MPNPTNPDWMSLFLQIGPRSCASEWLAQSWYMASSYESGCGTISLTYKLSGLSILIFPVCHKIGVGAHDTVDSMAELNRALYTVAWIAPLEIEAQAALHMLDERHHGRFTVARGDDYVFHAGTMCGHNVVVATLPAGQEYGTGSAAALAGQLKKSFPNLWFGLLVGVAAGLPDHRADPPRDIRLGDVLVALPVGNSAGLVAYDLGKETGAEGFQPLRFGHVLAETETVVRSAIGSIKLRAPHDADALLEHYDGMKHKEHATGTFADPGIHNDKLYKINGLGNEEEIIRDTRPSADRTRVWYGPIGSGEKLMRNSRQRNELRDKYGVIGLEMEAAGTMNRIPVGVIRGVCDYADEHKNKDWQPYAAAMAAAYAKAILCEIPPERGTRLGESTEPVHKRFPCDSRPSQSRPESRQSRWPEFQNERPALSSRLLERHDIPSCLTSNSDTWSTSGRDTPFTLVVYGLAGAGKSQICLKGIADNKQKFQSIFYVDASNRVSADSNFLEMSQICAIQNSWDGIELDHRIRLTRAWLGARREPWLLIFDNADASDVTLQKYIPTSGPGVIIITITDERLANCGSTFCKVEPMNKDHAMKLLMSYKRPDTILTSEELKAAEALAVNLLGGLPLAIAQAGSYIFNKRCTYTEYCREFAESPSVSLDYDYQRMQWSGHSGTVWTTFIISLCRIQSLPERGTREAVELLRTLSFLHNEGIQKRFFQKAWENMKLAPTWAKFLPLLDQKSPRWDTPNVQAAFEILCRYGLITCQSQQKQEYSVHRLVHTICRESLSNCEQQKYASVAISLISLALVDIQTPLTWIYNPSGFELENALVPHIRASDIDRVGTMLRSQDDQAFKIKTAMILRMSKACSATGLFWDARVLARGIHETLMTRGRTIRKFPSSLQAVEQLASCEAQLGNHYMALELRFELHAEYIGRKKQGDDSCVAMMNLADSLWMTGRKQEAMEIAREAMKRRQAALSSTDPRLLRTRRKVAEYLHGTNQRREALELREKILRESETRENASEVEQLDNLVTKNAMADSYHWDGQLLKALDLRREVYEGRLKTLGAHHPDTLLAHDSLLGTRCALVKRTEDKQEILQMRKRSVEAWKHIRGDDHPYTLEARVNLGRCYSSLSQWTKAEDELTAVFEIRKQAFEKQKTTATTISYLSSMGSVANVHMKMGYLTMALERREEAFQTARQCQHLLEIGVLSKIENSYLTCRRSQVTESLETLKGLTQRHDLLKKLLARAWPKDDVSALRTMSLYATDLRNWGDRNEALNVRMDLLERQRRVLGAENRETLRNMKKIALILFGHGPKLYPGYEEGLSMMKKVEEAESRLMGGDHKKTRRTRFELLDMHKRANENNEALDLRARLQRSSRKKADREARKSPVEGKLPARFNRTKVPGDGEGSHSSPGPSSGSERSSSDTNFLESGSESCSADSCSEEPGSEIDIGHPVSPTASLMSSKASLWASDYTDDDVVVVRNDTTDWVDVGEGTKG